MLYLNLNWHKVIFSEMIPEDRVVLVDDTLYVPESKAYKFIFMNNDVSEQNVRFACNHALQKVYRFIENYKA